MKAEVQSMAVYFKVEIYFGLMCMNALVITESFINNFMVTKSYFIHYTQRKNEIFTLMCFVKILNVSEF